MCLYCDYGKEGMIIMRKTKNNAAKFVTKTLNSVLKLEANSNSCLLAYQPKAPENLKKFRK